jgi:hypothetical protein
MIAGPPKRGALTFGCIGGHLHARPHRRSTMTKNYFINLTKSRLVDRVELCNGPQAVAKGSTI